MGSLRCGHGGVHLRMRGLLAVGALLVAVLSWPDGAVLAPVTLDSLKPEDLAAVETGQRAVVLWRDGRETLVLQINYRGPLTRLAWLVPLPSRPSREDLFLVREQFLETLFTTTAPRHDRHILGVKGLAPGAWPLAGVLPVLWLEGGMAGARSSGVEQGGPQASTVRLYQTLQLGPYDLTVLAASRPADLVAWLKKQSFSPWPGLEPVVEYYINRGWCFVVAQGRGSAGKTSAGHLPPLGLSFQAERPVYPLRVSRLSSRPRMSLRLLVLAPQAVQARGFDEVDPEAMSQVALPARQGPNQVPDRVRRRWAEATGHSTLLCEARAPWSVLNGSGDGQSKQPRLAIADGREVELGDLVVTRYWALLASEALDDLEFGPLARLDRQPAGTQAPRPYFLSLDRALARPALDRRMASPLWPLAGLIVAWLVAALLVGPIERLLNPGGAADVAPRPVSAVKALVQAALGVVVMLLGGTAGALLLTAASWPLRFSPPGPILVPLLAVVLLPIIIAGRVSRRVPRRRALVGLGLLLVTCAAIPAVHLVAAHSYHTVIAALALGGYLLILWLMVAFSGARRSGPALWPLADYLGLIVGIFFAVAEGALMRRAPTPQGLASACEQARGEILQALTSLARDNGCLPASLGDLTASHKPPRGVDAAGNPVPLRADSSWHGPYLATLPRDPITGRRDSWVYEPTGDLLVDSAAWKHWGRWMVTIPVQ